MSAPKWTAGIVLLVALGGCSAGNVTHVVPDPDSVPAAVLAAQCEYYVRCRFLPDVETCLASIPTPPQLLTLLLSLRAGRAVYRADRMAACIERTRTSGCSVAESFVNFSACVEAFEGTTPLGMACVDSHECASGECSFPDCGFLCCPQTCVAIMHGHVRTGGVCMSSIDCGSGLYCGPSSTCVGPLAEGESCTMATPCQAPLLCNSGKCGRLPAPGELCDPTAAGYACDRLDDYCDGATSTCLTRASAGETCTATLQDPVTGTCAGDSWCDAGTCRTKPRIGEPCAASVRCQSGLDCDLATSLCTASAPQQICQL